MESLQLCIALKSSQTHKMKDMENILDVKITKGRENIPLVPLAKRELQTALQPMESNWPEKAV